LVEVDGCFEVESFGMAMGVKSPERLGEGDHDFWNLYPWLGESVTKTQSSR
jgi:hypothetical protein